MFKFQLKFLEFFMYSSREGRDKKENQDLTDQLLGRPRKPELIPVR